MSEATSRQSVTSGMIWLMLNSTLSRVITFAIQILIAKFLLPEDYGIAGMTLSVAAMTSAIACFGSEQFLLSKGKGADLWSHYFIFLGAVLSFVIYVAVLSFSILTGVGRDSIMLYLVGGLTSIPASLSVPYQVRLQLDHRFKVLATCNLLESLGVQCFTLALAVLQFGASSIVIPFALIALLRFFYLRRLANLIMPRKFLRSEWKHVSHKAGFSFGSRISTTIVDQIDYLLIGAISGASAAGFYYFAFRLSSQPMRILAGNFVSAMTPSLVLKESLDTGHVHYALDSAEVLACLVAPVSFFLAVAAPSLFHLLFGAKWNESIIVFQVISVGLAFNSIGWPAESLLVSRGLLSKIFIINVISVPIFVITISTGAFFFGLYGAACSVALFYALQALTISLSAFTDQPANLARVLKCFLVPPLCGAIAFQFTGLLVLSDRGDDKTITIILFGAIGLVAYILLVRLFMPRVYGFFKKNSTQYLRRTPEKRRSRSDA